ncbi:hypothetical protein B4Q13_20225, partial [Lacticaseibacillus rhamnosus]
WQTRQFTDLVPGNGELSPEQQQVAAATVLMEPGQVSRMIPSSDGGFAVYLSARAPGGNRSGIVVGLARTLTVRHPEGVTRVVLMGDPLRALGAVAEAEKIIDRRVRSFGEWQSSRAAVPAIVELRRRAEQYREVELARARART